MRTHGLSLDAAAREAGTTPKTVRRYAGSALHKTKPGKYRVRATDTMLRSLVIPRNGGLAEIVTRDSRSASIVAQYANAVQAFLQTGDEPELQRFRGLQIVDAEGNHITLLTDLDELERLGAFGALSFESLYAKVR